MMMAAIKAIMMDKPAPAIVEALLPPVLLLLVPGWGVPALLPLLLTGGGVLPEELLLIAVLPEPVPELLLLIAVLPVLELLLLPATAGGGLILMAPIIRGWTAQR